MSKYFILMVNVKYSDPSHHHRIHYLLDLPHFYRIKRINLSSTQIVLIRRRNLRLGFNYFIARKTTAALDAANDEVCYYQYYFIALKTEGT